MHGDKCGLKAPNFWVNPWPGHWVLGDWVYLFGSFRSAKVLARSALGGLFIFPTAVLSGNSAGSPRLAVVSGALCGTKDHPEGRYFAAVAIS